MSADIIPIQTSGAEGEGTFPPPDGSTWVKLGPGQSPQPHSGGGGDMTDWKASVEGRLNDLRDDYKTLWKYGLSAVAFMLAAGGTAYGDLKGDTFSIRVDLSDIVGEIRKVGGQLDILAKQENAYSETSTQIKPTE